MRKALPLVLTVVMGLLVACDNFVEYSIDNQTSQHLTSWILYDACEDAPGNNGDYDYERSIPPYDRIDVFDATGPLPGEPWCVQVVTTDRRLVLSEPYVYGGEYVVREPLEPGVLVPLESGLPGKSLWDQIGDRPMEFVVLGLGLVVAAVTLIALPYGIYRAVKDLRRYAKQRPS